MLIDNGVACDNCGTTYNNDFIYYSWDFYPVQVINGRKPSLDQILSSKISISYDICQQCWDHFRKLIIDNYSKGSVCEITGDKLSDAYYYVVVTSVDVMMSGQPSVCEKCQYQINELNKPCEKCGSMGFIKHARVTTDTRFVEFNVSEEICTNLRKSVENIIKVAGQWSTQS